MTRVTSSTPTEAATLAHDVVVVADALRAGHPGLLDPLRRDAWADLLDRVARLLAQTEMPS